MIGTRKLAAVMFTDIVGYTTLMSGDERKAMQVLQKNREFQKHHAERYNGEFLKEMGDGTLLCFQSASEAVSCALAIQQSSKDVPDLEIRIGIHLGDILFNSGDVFGDGVNVASRIEPLAEPGGVCISDQIYQIIRNLPEFEAVSIGEQRLKNVDYPVHIYTVNNNQQLIDNPPSSSFQPLFPEKRSIAVLPFTNMSADNEQEYFCDGITEDIINDLTHLNNLHVVARTSSFAFKGRTRDIREIGTELGAHTIVEGSVRKAGNRLRITVQLVNVEDGYHLWSERYDRELEDVFVVQEEISKNIVQALEITLSKQEICALEKVQTQDFHAYDFYLRGREFFHQGQHKSIRYAIEMFTNAIKRDLNYALAYAGLADCYSYLFMYFENNQENIQESMAASTKAIELDPGLAEAHTARGLAVSLSMRYEEAEKEFDRAIQLNPKLFEAFYFYARNCRQQGNIEKAVLLFEKANEIRPGDYQATVFLVSAYKKLSFHAKAENTAHLAVELIEKHLRLNPDDARALYLGGGVLIILDRVKQAIDWAKRAHEIAPDDSRVTYNIACIYSLAGRIEQALDCIEKAIGSGYASLGWIENDSDLDPIRDQPRFQQAIKKLKQGDLNVEQ